MRYFENVNFISILRLAVGFLVVVWAVSGQSQDAELTKKCASATLISFEDAQSLATERGRAELPPLAKQIGLKGVVRVETCVSEDGLVILTKPAGGSPLLIPAGIESAKSWKFRPFLEAGQPAAFRTVLEIAYLSGSAVADVNREEEDNRRYFQTENVCRADLKARDLKQADLDCRKALDLVEKLPKERLMERQSANGLVGRTYFALERFAAALPFYQKELEISKAHQQTYEAELAYAYYHVALTLDALGRVDDATLNYSLSETILTAARDHIHDDSFKAQYSKTLANIRNNFLALLQESGQNDKARELQQRINNAK